MKKGNIISTKALTSYFDVALNKRNASQWAVFRVWLFTCNDPMSLAVRNSYLSTTIERLT